MKYLFSLLFSIFLFSCATTNMVKNPPFTILDANYQNWFGGREGVKGISIKIVLKDIAKNTTFTNIYFKNEKLPVFVTTIGKGKFLSANLNTGKLQGSLNMHKNQVKEYGNSLPKSKKDFPFTLKENEAVISYTKGNKEYFYKLTLQKEKDLFMP